MPPLSALANPPPPPAALKFQLKPTRQPMLWAALAYSLGITSGIYAWRPASWWLAAAAAFFAAGLYFVKRARRKYLSTLLALGTFFLAGALHIQLRGSTVPLDISLQLFADGQPVEITAHVITEGRFKEASPNEIRQSLDVETEEIFVPNSIPIPVHAGVRLGIYSAPERQRPLHLALLPRPPHASCTTANASAFLSS
jgi:hypothetical protein